MSAAVVGVGLIYSALVLNFYFESGGYIKFYTPSYSLWKTTPVLFLSIVSAVYSRIAGNATFIKVAAGLLFGAIGDYLIGLSEDGIVTGAIAFGIGHIFYLLCFYKNFQINVPFALIMTIWGGFASYATLVPMLSQHPIPVFILSIYSILLMFNVCLAVSQHLNRPTTTFDSAVSKRALGFFLFFISDSLLIFHHTGFKIPYAECLILNSYFAAQFFIFQSFVVSELKSKKKIN
ncbi:unnamed protein product [Auanema sp. JU1783]|nr:unnamed protein product [Auanema sp. JU1783]